MNMRGRVVNKRGFISIFGILLVSLVLTACKGTTKEEQRMIDNSIKAIENRDYEYAREALGSVVEGNNKEVDKLWNIVYCFQEASTELYANKNIDKAKEYLNKMDGSYTKYSTLKEDVEKIKTDIKEREDYIVEVDNLIKEVESSISNKNYEVYKKAQGTIININGSKFYFDLPSKQRDKVTELDAKINNELFELRKVEDKKQLESESNELKSQDEKFTVEMAKEFAEKNRSINTGNTRFEVISDSQYDQKEEDIIK
ncbi:MAG TPA: hypothetical protein DCR69_12665 [Clostridium sp.]|nr:hypothetical protein [Clostridium sp.]